METITKAKLVARMERDLHLMGEPRMKKDIMRELNAFLYCIREHILEGYHIRFKKVGWIGGKFKPGGRPVRNPKTGEAKEMYDTYSIRLTPHLKTSYEKRINSSEIPELMEYHNITPKISKLIYQTLVEALKIDVLEKGNRIEIRGFGTFNRRHLKPRRSRNPKTGEEVFLSDRYDVAFKSSTHLAPEMNKRMGIA